MNGLPLQAFVYVLEYIAPGRNNLHNLLNIFINSLFHPNYSKLKLLMLLNNVEKHLKTKIFIPEIRSLSKFEVQLDEEKVLNLIKIILEGINNKDIKIISAGLNFRKELEYYIPSLTINTTDNVENLPYILIEKILPIPIHFLNDCWCAITRGGGIKLDENKLMLDFSGLRNIFIEKFRESNYLKLVQEIENYNAKKYEELKSKILKEELIQLRKIFEEISTFATDCCKVRLPSEIFIDSSIPLVFDSYAKWSAIFLINLFTSANIANLHHLLLQVSYQREFRRIEIQNVFRTEYFSEDVEREILGVIEIMKCLCSNYEFDTKKDNKTAELHINYYIQDKLGSFLDTQIPYWEYLSNESKDILRRLSYNFKLPEYHPFIYEIIKFELTQSLLNFFEKPVIVNISNDILQNQKEKLSNKLKKLLEHIAKQRIKRSDLDFESVLSFFEILTTNSNYFERLKFKQFTLQDLGKLCTKLKSPENTRIETLQTLCLLLMEINK